MLPGNSTPERKPPAIELPREVIANGEVILEFEFYSSSNDTGPNPSGFYIDNIVIYE